MLSAPELKLATSDTLSDPTASNRKNTVGLEWSPPAPGETTLRRTLNERRRDEAVGAEALARHKLAAEVRGAHATLRVLEALVEEADAAQALRERLRSVGQEQVAARRRTQAEQVATELQVSEAAVAREALRQERAQAAARLGGLLASSAGQEPVTVAPETLVAAGSSAGSDLEPAWSTAVQERPEFRALAARCAGVSAETNLQRLADRPWIKDVQVTYATQQGGKPATWGLQVGVTLPVTGPQNGASAVGDSLRAACGSEQALLEQTVRQEVADSQRRVLAAREVWARLQREVLPLHERAVQLAQEARRAGRLDEGEWLTLNLRRAEARQTALRRLLELRLAEVALRQALGRAAPG